MLSNIYGHNIFLIFYICFFISTFVVRKYIRKKTLARKKIAGDVIAGWTTKYIFYVYLFLYFGSFAEYFAVHRKINLIISAIGVLFYIMGIAGRQWAWSSLGAYWSTSIEIRKNHKLIIAGPYRYLRHPNNLFHIIEILGFIMIPNAFYVLGFFILLYLPVLLMRVFIEEKYMKTVLGADYLEYMKKVGGIIPSLIKKGGYTP